VDCLLSIIVSLEVYVYVLETFKALGAPGAPLYIHTYREIYALVQVQVPFAAHWLWIGGES
jgi:hypothetical protein